MRDEPDWYRDAIIYEVNVRAFQDTDGDGMGDFRGLTRRLDYLQDLGVTAIWLLPFYPSPLRDDGYDIADYTDIHENYGTLRDFRDFLDEAHRRGLRVITELVLNHTSDQHPWFQRARHAQAGSVERDFYVWSDATDSETPERFEEARIIFQDFERSNWAWDPVARAYYWHRFYSHQPDLNYDNPAVVEAMLEVVDFWLGMGVDGLRLDAAPYLFEREGTSCENLPETYEFFKQLRAHIDGRFTGRMMLAEANQWPEDAAAYFGDGDACHMAFHFPLMPRMFMAIHMEDRLPIVDILAQTPDLPEGCQWATFLRNHDELTLEMVTDEERDYMNRVYASEAQARINLGIRRRLAPLLRNNRRRIELMNALLLSMPGTPVLYYGDEIGMGDNIYLGDRNGVRTPMQWSSERNAGFSRGNPQSLFLPVVTDPEFHYAAINVEAQIDNPHSLLSWTKRIVALRKRHRAFGRGSIAFLDHGNEKVLAFLRAFEGETILVVANLSRYVQPVTLDLARFAGMRPVELFGHIAFPPVGELPYALTLGPHAFYWFAMEPVSEGVTKGEPSSDEVPSLRLANGLGRLADVAEHATVESALLAYLDRYDEAIAPRRLRFLEILDALPIPIAGREASLLLLRAEFYEGQPVAFQLTVALAAAEAGAAVVRDRPETILARLEAPGNAVLYDASTDPEVLRALLALLSRGESVSGRVGELEARPSPMLAAIDAGDLRRLRAAPLPGPRSNLTISLGDRYVFKFYSQLEEGVNPDQEVNQFLTEQCQFAHVPRFAGAIHYRHGRTRPMTLATLQDYVPNRGTAWDLATQSAGDFFRHAQGHRGAASPTAPKLSPLRCRGLQPPPEVTALLGDDLERARRIGRRTAELHRALASRSDASSFAPEPFRALDQRSNYQSLRGRMRRVMRALSRGMAELPEAARAGAHSLLEHQDEILLRYRELLTRRVSATRIRIHGDYHLGQLLATGDDFVIIDFEGESFRPIGQRRLKRLPLRDVLGLVNSIHYAGYSTLSGQRREDDPGDDGQIGPAGVLRAWANAWVDWVSATFLDAYLATIEAEDLLPRDPDGLEVLFACSRLDRSLESLGYELERRRSWAWIPLASLERQLELSP